MKHVERQPHTESPEALDSSGHEAPTPGRLDTGERSRRRGLTLIEILVVVSILGVIASLVGISVLSEFDGVKLETAKIQMGDLSKALDLYKVKFDGYPRSLDELAHPQKGQKSIVETVPKDPWNNDFVYVYPDPGNSGRFRLRSRGEDGVLDTDDDLEHRPPRGGP
jgi:general secretion pathway protein G